MSVIVIVPAAGTGSRFGSGIPKQFQQLSGKPLVQHVIERFLLDENVTRVVVPVAEVLLASVKNSERVSFVAGGATRQQSVINGLAEAEDAELIAVHDAARPLFSTAIFHAVIEAAREVGAALGRNPFPPVVPCHRVVAAGGRAGGFSARGGVATKLKLLEMERAHAGSGLPLFDAR